MNRAKFRETGMAMWIYLRRICCLLEVFIYLVSGRLICWCSAGELRPFTDKGIAKIAKQLDISYAEAVVSQALLIMHSH